ncbi:hypothetical protein [Nostoc sp. JL31]|nr:hypothetical protein [Nostoc sp. JL31]
MGNEWGEMLAGIEIEAIFWGVEFVHLPIRAFDIQKLCEICDR